MTSAVYEVQIVTDTELGPLCTLCPVLLMTTLEVEAISPDFPDEETKAENKPATDDLTPHGQDSD